MTGPPIGFTKPRSPCLSPPPVLGSRLGAAGKGVDASAAGPAAGSTLSTGGSAGVAISRGAASALCGGEAGDRTTVLPGVGKIPRPLSAVSSVGKISAGNSHDGCSNPGIVGGPMAAGRTVAPLREPATTIRSR